VFSFLLRDVNNMMSVCLCSFSLLCRDHSRATSAASHGGDVSLGRTLFDRSGHAAEASSSSSSSSSSSGQQQHSLVPLSHCNREAGGEAGGEAGAGPHGPACMNSSSSGSSGDGGGGPPLTARSAHSAAPSQLAGRFFDQTSTADKGRFRVGDAR
jgi:hypothetical protein